jgi:hypothetical protein
MGEVEGNLRGILKQIAAVFYVVEDRDRKGRIDLPKDLSRRPETDGSISSVNVPKARRSNDDRNIRVQTESVAHFQKSLAAIGRPPCFVAVSLPGFERCTVLIITMLCVAQVSWLSPMGTTVRPSRYVLCYC